MTSQPKYLKIDLTKCVECGEDSKHHHHVVPEVFGGTFTVPLCEGCHSKIHGIDFSTSTLVKEGLARAKTRGVHVGGVPFGMQYSDRVDADGNRELVENPEEEIILTWIDLLHNDDMAPGEIAKQLNNEGYTTRPGSAWTARSVQRHLKNIDEEP